MVNSPPVSLGKSLVLQCIDHGLSIVFGEVSPTYVAQPWPINLLGRDSKPMSVATPEQISAEY